MAEWRETTIGELGQLFDGPHATPSRISEGPYFLNIASLNNGRLDLLQSDHVSQEDFNRWTRRVTPREGDLLFSYETRLGQAALMPSGIEACLGRRMALIRPNIEEVDPRFLLYLYLSPAFQEIIRENTIHGATVERIALSTMDRWSVSIPGLPLQKAIAEVLGALDDKIAANTRATRSAVALVDAHFEAAVKNASLSEKTFDDVARIGGGGTPSSKVSDYWGGDIAWASPTDITALPAPYLASTGRTITEAGLASCSSSLYPVGSILMTSRATIGAFALAAVPTAVNQGFIVVVPPDRTMRFWLFHEMRARVPEFLNHANGATFLELSRGNFRRLPVRLADRPTMDEFAARAEALHDLAAAATDENRRLAATRDALLPALMSGRLRVKDAEKVVSDAV